LSVRSIAYGVDQSSNRMSAVPKKKLESAVVSQIDPFEVLEKTRAGKNRAYDLKLVGASTLVLSFNDWQYGKRTNQGGTEDTVCGVKGAVENAKRRMVALRLLGYELGELVLIFGGDLVEGCTIYPNMSFSLELNQKKQVEGCVALGLHIFDELAPLFDRVQVLGVRGNHGENRINGKNTTADDNMDTHVVEMMKLALSRDKDMAHISWVVAGEESGVVSKVAGWVLGTTHGDVYGKGVSGATVERKAFQWYKNMAAGRDLMGSADVLVTHHYHHRQMAEWGACEWHQTPAQDMAMSEYFRQSTGMYSAPGVLSFVMTPDSRYCEEAIL